MKELFEYGEDRFGETSREGWQTVKSVGLEMVLSLLKVTHTHTHTKTPTPDLYLSVSALLHCVVITL